MRPIRPLGNLRASTRSVGSESQSDLLFLIGLSDWLSDWLRAFAGKIYYLFERVFIYKRVFIYGFMDGWKSNLIRNPAVAVKVSFAVSVSVSVSSRYILSEFAFPLPCARIRQWLATYACGCFIADSRGGQKGRCSGDQAGSEGAHALVTCKAELIRALNRKSKAR
jgi:hypothetical protein